MRASLIVGLTAGVLLTSAMNDNANLAIAAKPARHVKGSAVNLNQTMIKTANAFVDLLASNKFEQSRSYLSPEVKGVLPAPKLQLAWQGITMQMGAYKQRKAARLEKVGPHTCVFVPVVFGDKTVELRIVFSGSSKITGFFFEQPKGDYKEAGYVDPKSYTEQKVKVGSGKWQLDGVLTVPNGDGPFPAIVLVHGSGPQDMDETIGPNKPFRDLAHGLASKGVAVVRYEKRTKQHAKSLNGADLLKLTIKEETVDDAVEAANLVRSNPKIDKSKIVILGHSLGGMAVPRIAQSDSGVRAFIVMAGSNEPMETAIVRQAEYLTGLDKTAEKASKPQIDALKAEAAKIKALKPSDSGSRKVILGAPATYWLDMKVHDPLIEIRSVDRPILFLQGGRDYQVTADGDLERWKSTVKSAGHETQCTFKLYPDLNHLFSSGTGKCTPNEYMKRAANVDAKVIDDIVEWMKSL